MSNSNPIVGQWKYYSLIYEFHDDGTYDYLNTDSGHSAQGDYVVSGDILKFVTMGSSAKISIHGNSLDLAPYTPQRGPSQTFTRVY
jgi:hypothetical protein